MHNYRELKVWQKARAMVKDIYLVTENFPNDEKFGLTSQIRRCSISIPSNIAEGSGRATKKDFSHFLNISLGSAYELETQVILAYDLRLMDQKTSNRLTHQIQEIQKMIIGFHRSL